MFNDVQDEDNFCLNSNPATAKAEGSTQKLLNIQPNCTEINYNSHYNLFSYPPHRHSKRQFKRTAPSLNYPA
jgi:hypothetical protein